MPETQLSWACALVLVGTPRDCHRPRPGQAGSRVSPVSLGSHPLAKGPVISLLPTQVTWLGTNGSGEAVP